MTLNDLESHDSLYFCVFFSRNSTDFQADYITVVEDRHNIILSVKYRLPMQFQSSTFGENYNFPCSTLSLHAIDEHLVIS